MAPEQRREAGYRGRTGRSPVRRRVSVALAAAPVLVVLGALLLRRPAWQAAAAGLAVIALTTWLAGTPVDLGTAAGNSAVLVLEVGLGPLGGLALAEVGRRRGFPEAVTSYVAATGAPRPAVVLLVVLGLTPFAESVTGFGVGAVIAAPTALRLRAAPARGGGGGPARAVHGAVGRGGHPGRRGADRARPGRTRRDQRRRVAAGVPHGRRRGRVDQRRPSSRAPARPGPAGGGGRAHRRHPAGEPGGRHSPGGRGRRARRHGGRDRGAADAQRTPELRRRPARWPAPPPPTSSCCSA